MWDYSDHKAPTQFICALGQVRNTYKKKSSRLKHLAFSIEKSINSYQGDKQKRLGCEAILDFLRKFKRLQSAAPFLNLSGRWGFKLQSLMPPTEFDKTLWLSHFVLSGQKTQEGKCGIRQNQKVPRAHVGLHRDATTSLLQHRGNRWNKWGYSGYYSWNCQRSMLWPCFPSICKAALSWTCNLHAHFSIGFSKVLQGFKCLICITVSGTVAVKASKQSWKSHHQ